MKCFKLTFLFSLALSLIHVAHGMGFGVEAGFKQQSGEVPTGFTTSSQVGYTFGAVGFFDFSERLALRSGIMYTQRPLKVTNDTTNGSSDVNLTYFDVPISLMLKFEDWMGAYIGTAISLNLDKSSSNKSVVDLKNVKSMMTPLQLGVTFKFMPDIGLNLYFEQFGDVADGLTAYKSVGANLLFTME